MVKCNLFIVLFWKKLLDGDCLAGSMRVTNVIILSVSMKIICILAMPKKMSMTQLHEIGDLLVHKTNIPNLLTMM